MYHNRAMKDCWNQAGEQFPVLLLSRLQKPIGEGVVLCLCKQIMPLAQDIDAVPVGII
jgi:hypothetical protein